jgi:hypothetical protein
LFDNDLFDLLLYGRCHTSSTITWRLNSGRDFRRGGRPGGNQR